MIRLAVLWPGCSCLSWERGTCHVCVWPQAPLVLQPAADLGGRQQTLSGKELMICAVTTSSLLGHPGTWQSSASSLKLDELINEPGKSGIAASSITPVFFSRELCPIPAAGAQAAVSLCLSVPWLLFLPTKVVRREVGGTGTGGGKGWGCTAMCPEHGNQVYWVC